MNDAEEEDGPQTITYFIDEAGTATLFDRRGRQSIVGTESSTYFILGKLEVGDPTGLSQALEALRNQLLADPYFAKVPSMQPGAGKTAVMFHAKNDLPEIRDRVFHLLMEQDVKFSAVVRDKRKLLELVSARNEAEPNYRYSENEIYDDLVSQLFKTGFHQADHFELVFATRNEKDRSEAFRAALAKAKAIYEHNFGVSTKHTLRVVNSSSIQNPGLQAVDYFLWALQRLYEKKEERFWDFVWPKVRSVHDLDDVRENTFGTIYRHGKPITIQSRI